MQPSSETSPFTIKEKRKAIMITGGRELVYEDGAHAAEILRGHNSLWTSRLLCDVTLCVDDKEFPCHKTVLASSSAYFKAMFTGNLSEASQRKVALKDVDPTTLKELLEFMYTSKIVVTASNVHSLLETSDKFQILSAQAACCQLLEQHLDFNNCFQIYTIAGTYSCQDLYAKARDFIIDNLGELGTLKDFFELSSTEVIGVISSDLLEMDEEDVFNCIIRWYDKDPDKRSEDFYKMFKHVRLPLLAPTVLYNCVEQSPVVKNCVKCKALVEDAKRFLLLPDQRREMHPEWNCFRKGHASQEVIVSVRTPEDGHPQTTNIDLYLIENKHTVPCVVFGTVLQELDGFAKFPGIAALLNSLYLIGGELTGGEATNYVSKYNLEYDVWTELENMTVARCQPAVAFLHGCIYVLGGRDGTDWMASMEFYIPELNRWKKGIEMPMALQHITAVAFKGCIYASGIPVSLLNTQVKRNNFATMLCYNSAMSSWSELPPMPCPCYGSTAYISNNQIWLIGGKNIGLESTRTIQSYHPVEKKWTIQSSSVMPHYRPGVAVIGGITLLGYDNSYPEQGIFEFKNKTCNSWQLVVQECKVDYMHLQWTSCVVLEISKDALNRHMVSYETENSQLKSV